MLLCALLLSLLDRSGCNKRALLLLTKNSRS